MSKSGVDCGEWIQNAKCMGELLSGAVVTDAMLRGLQSPAAIDAEQARDAAAAEI